MANDNQPSADLRLFISYSRQDLDFADQLVAALDAFGFKTTIDRKGIHGAEKWEQRLGQLILESDTIVAVITPNSATSEACRWEVDEAVKLAKRIVPIVWQPLGDVKPHAYLQDLNYIFFYPEPHVPGSGFGQGLADLVEALSTDVEWMREHTRTNELALRWENAGRPSDLLVRGSELKGLLEWREARRPRRTRPSRPRSTSPADRSWPAASWHVPFADRSNSP